MPNKKNMNAYNVSKTTWEVAYF